MRTTGIVICTCLFAVHVPRAYYHTADEHQPPNIYLFCCDKEDLEHMLATHFQLRIYPLLAAGTILVIGTTANFRSCGPGDVVDVDVG